MEAVHFTTERATPLAAVPDALPADGWMWLDVLQDEACAHPDALRDAVAQLTGVRLFDLHLRDATNLQHPSYFDRTQDYDMVVFRKLSAAEAPPLAEVARASADAQRVLQEIVTRPITFFVFDRVLVTVRDAGSRTIEQLRARLLDVRGRSGDGSAVPDKLRLPHRPDELMLRMLNALVDHYLELRQPLTTVLDRWQRELLDPRRPFNNWRALLDARNEIRKLEDLCEEQVDALQELRDSYLESHVDVRRDDAYLVRIADLVEHVNRVLHHARRLESSIETAVQIHFNAQSNRTNQIVQTLTVITAIFAPLTLITGIFGMNFKVMPVLEHPNGFWITIAAMIAIAVALLAFFWMRRYLRVR